MKKTAGRTEPGRKFLLNMGVSLAGAALAVGLWSLGWLDTWEGSAWDWRAELLARPGLTTDDIRLILLDQNSLDWAKAENGLGWPWPRELYAAIVSYCQRSGAKALAFDVLFTEPSKYGVADDEVFGAAVSEFGRTAVAIFLGRTTGSEREWPAGFPEPRFKAEGLDEWLARTKPRGVSFPRATLIIPELAKNAAVLCNVHPKPDPDGVYRQIKLLGIFDRRIVPALGLGLFMAANSRVGIKPEHGRLVVGEKTIPTDKDGNAVLRYRGPSGTHRSFSAAAVLQSEIRIRMGEKPVIRDRNAFKDKYVLFGFTAPGLYDLRPTPMGGVYPGVEIHATLLDNYLSGDFIQKVPPRFTLVLIIVLALLCSAFIALFSSPAGSMAVSALFFVMPVAFSVGAYIKGFWLPLIVQETAVFLSIALSLMVNYVTEGRQKRFIKNAFGRYLSPAVIEQLIQHPDRLELGGERKTLSIFFSDLQGFTSISEKLIPEKLTDILNQYLSAMTDIILEEGGTVDKYEGDAIIAFWNAPIDIPDHAVRVVRAALRCQAKLAEMRPDFRTDIGTDMLMRIGINTGPAVVGNLGSRTRFDYTMLGDAVNLAARLEGINKQFGIYTMISEFTREQIGDVFAVREIARVAVIGRKEPVTVYEPMFWEDYKAREGIFRFFASALNLFYNGRFEQAQAIFHGIRDIDAAAVSYEKKCRMLMASPPGNWQGVWVMTTK